MSQRVQHLIPNLQHCLKANVKLGLEGIEIKQIKDSLSPRKYNIRKYNSKPDHLWFCSQPFKLLGFSVDKIKLIEFMSKRTLNKMTRE
jgi:hypothetical protein